MFKHLKRIAVAIRESDSCGWMVSADAPHTKKYEDEVLKIISWAKGGYRAVKGAPEPKFEVFDNEMIEGFEVSRQFRRCSYYGSGNVIWRIADPRGFELEIASESFAKLVSEVTIENGLIKNKCMWGRNGNSNMLIPENSETYQEYIQSTDTQDLKPLTTKEINAIPIGSRITIRIGDVLEDAVFFGHKHYILFEKEPYTRPQSSRQWFGDYTRTPIDDQLANSYKLKQRRSIFVARHVFNAAGEEEANNFYHDAEGKSKYDIVKVHEIVNLKYPVKFSYGYNKFSAMFLSDKKINLSDLEYRYINQKLISIGEIVKYKDFHFNMNIEQYDDHSDRKLYKKGDTSHNLIDIKVIDDRLVRIHRYERRDYREWLNREDQIRAQDELKKCGRPYREISFRDDHSIQRTAYLIGFNDIKIGESYEMLGLFNKNTGEWQKILH